MSEHEYIHGDAESINMVRENRACHPGGTPVILMGKEEAQYLMERALRKEKKTPTKEAVMMQAMQLLVPVVIGVSWLLGAAEGLADPVFAVISAVICGLWSVGTYKWGDYNA